MDQSSPSMTLQVAPRRLSPEPRFADAAALPLRILLASDAWRPQVNGVVRTIEGLVEHAPAHGAEITLVTPAGRRSIPMPGYPEIRLSLEGPAAVARAVEAARPNAIHIATEGPIGFWVRRYCLAHGIPFTTCYHTRYPEYVAARLPIPLAVSYAWLRRFHNAGRATMVSTRALQEELASRGFDRLVTWQRGIDVDAYARGRQGRLGLPRPIFLCVSRIAVEKNVEAFLKLDLPGSKVVVGDGPARADLERRYPNAVFLGRLEGRDLADVYASADSFVFPSRTETFGLVMLEALAAGLPIAAYPVTGPREVLAGSRCGALFDDLRIAALASLAIPREACRAFAARHTMAESARSFVQNVRAALLQAPDRSL